MMQKEGPRADLSPEPSKVVDRCMPDTKSCRVMTRKRATTTPSAAHGSLSEKLKHLNPKRQEIIRPVLENPRPFVLLSVRALADQLGTDPATTVRIVQGLGFETYKDFQRHLHDLSVAYATSLDTMKAAEQEGTGPTALVRASLQRDLQNLQALNNSLDATKIGGLAKRLYEASKIVLLGGDAATSLVHHLEYHLTMIGLPVLLRHLRRASQPCGAERFPQGPGDRHQLPARPAANRRRAYRPPSATVPSRLPSLIHLFHHLLAPPTSALSPRWKLRPSGLRMWLQWL